MIDQFTKFLKAFLSAYRSISRMIHKDGLALFIAILSLTYFMGIVAGFITFPWNEVKASIKAEGTEVVNSVASQHSTFMQMTGQNASEMLQEQRETTDAAIKNKEATVALCRIMAEASHLDPEACGN